MEKEENKQQQPKKQILINNLYNFINSTKDQKLQLKPQDDNGDILQRDQKFKTPLQQKDLEEYKKDYSSRIDKQIVIIAQNISNSLFALNNEKFSAFMSRYSIWGLDLTIEQFILNFYLVVKTDNMLRQFVLLHLDKIIKSTGEFIEKYLITHMFDFDFREPRTDFVKQQLIKQKKANDFKLKEKLKDRNYKKKQKKQEEVQIPEQHVEGEVPPIEPFEAKVDYPNSIPQILTLDDVMNMTEKQKENISQTAENKGIPQIQDNMKDVTPKKEKKQNNKKQSSPEEQKTDEEKKIQQQILANLKKQHQNLQKGVTNNG